jgi:hypothetical protein
MAVLPRPASPRAFIADLRAIWSGDRRHKLIGLAVAVGMTSLIITGFIVEARHGILPEGQQITYAADYSSTRTDAEIIAQQKIDQRAKEAALAEKRRAFQKVDRQLSGLGI